MYQEISIMHKDVTLEGHLSWNDNPEAWVIFAHGSGSSHHSPRNNWVAGELNKHGYGTFLFDLLTPEEDEMYQNRFDIPLLARRLLTATEWLIKSHYYQNEPIVYFGASTGAGAALMAAAEADEKWPLFAVISRGGRPDLASKEKLKKINRPVLLIVGSLDTEVIELNKYAQDLLKEADLILISGATHLFEEPGTLNEVVSVTKHWLQKQLPDSKHREINL